MCLPYHDHVYQNLWQDNHGQIKICKYVASQDDLHVLSNMLRGYHNKPLIEVGYQFIDDAVANNQKILVHCMAGISRSVSLVIYYFMKKHYMSYQTALDVIRKNRCICNPNASFYKQLSYYEHKREHYNSNDAKDITLQFKNANIVSQKNSKNVIYN